MQTTISMTAVMPSTRIPASMLEAAQIEPGEGLFHPVGRDRRSSRSAMKIRMASSSAMPMKADPDEVALARQLLPEEEGQHVGQQGQAQDGQRGIEDGVVAHHRSVSLIASGFARCPR